MASTFPTSIDNFTNNTDNVDNVIAQDVNDLNDAVEALEAKVGIDNSAVSTSIDYIIKNKIWPVGSIFLSVVPTNPTSLMGFGTWSQIAGGKVLVGQTDGDSDFNVAEETGGAKTATIAQANLPNISTGAGTAHTHIQNAHDHTVSGSGGTDNYNSSEYVRTDSSGGYYPSTSSVTPTNQNESAHTHSLGGSGTAMSVMNPYFTVYCFKRTA